MLMRMEWMRERKARWQTRRWVTDRRVVPADPLPTFELRGVLMTWNEEDIVGTTVTTLFEQGCSSVHLIDNDSDDHTVEIARSAGAVIEANVITDVFNLRALHEVLHDVVGRVSRASESGHVWWLHVDADELVEGPDGTTVLQLLCGLDRRHRVVGSRTINHYPRRDQPFEPGADPRWWPTNAQERRGTSCRLGHWKHPLLRWDADGPLIAADHGFHVVRTPERLVEPRTAIVSHHYPFRARAVTQARVEKLRDRVTTYQWAMGRREANLDAVYREAYEQVDAADMIGPGQRLAPEPRGPVRSP